MTSYTSSAVAKASALGHVGPENRPATSIRHVLHAPRAHARRRLMAIAIVSVLSPVPLAAQAWTQVSSTGPSPRFRHAMAYDNQRGVAVLFGGYDNTSGFLRDTWEWNGSNWSYRTTSGPTARSRPAMAYDSVRGRIVLFGGLNLPSSSPYPGDTWEWGGSNWTQVASTGPAGRYHHAMSFDSQRGRTVMFGGESYSGYYGDTWEWDGSSWTMRSSTGPSARRNHAIAYDGQRGKTVLFGGDPLTGGPLGDTWEWDGSTWTLAATGAPPRAWHAMVYDSQRGKTVLFGGLDSGQWYVGDTWSWDGSNWMQEAASGPSARYLHAMAYDSQRGKIVLLGGDDSAIGWLGDTWEWDGGFVSTASPFGSGCGSPALDLSPVAAARPTIGSTAQVALTNIPSAVAFVSIGWNNTHSGALALPFSLAGYGMPGCVLLQSATAAAVSTMPAGPGAATYSLPLPNWSALIGRHLYVQGWAPAPGANLAGVIVSNGVDWSIGNS